MHAIHAEELEPPLPQDCDETAVRTELWSHDGAMLSCTVVVQHRGETVVRVVFPDGWRTIVRALGHDAYDTAVEGYIETLAKIAFRGRR